MTAIDYVGEHMAGGGGVRESYSSLFTFFSFLLLFHVYNTCFKDG